MSEVWLVVGEIEHDSHTALGVYTTHKKAYDEVRRLRAKHPVQVRDGFKYRADTDFDHFSLEGPFFIDAEALAEPWVRYETAQRRIDKAIVYCRRAGADGYRQGRDFTLLTEILAGEEK